MQSWSSSRVTSSATSALLAMTLSRFLSLCSFERVYYSASATATASASALPVPPYLHPPLPLRYLISSIQVRRYMCTHVLHAQVEIEGPSTPQISVFDRDDGTYLVTWNVEATGQYTSELPSLFVHLLMVSAYVDALLRVQDLTKVFVCMVQCASCYTDFRYRARPSCL